MAKVEQYESKQNVSSAVGVPEEDTSGQMLAKSLGGAIQEVAQVKYERQQLADNIAAEAHASDYALKQRELINGIQKSYLGTDTPPDKIMEDIQKQSKDLQGQYLQGMNTPGLKNAFAMKSNEVNKSQYQEAYTQSLAHQSDQMIANMHISGNNIAAQNGQIFADVNTSEAQKMDAMNGLLNQGMAHLATLQKVVTPEKFMVARDQFLKNFAIAGINGAMDTNPELAKKLIDEKTFAGQLTPLESAQLKKDAVQQMAYNKTLGKINGAIGTAEGDREMISRATSTDPNVVKPTLSEIAQKKALGDGGFKGGISRDTAEDLKALIKIQNEGDDAKFTQRLTEYNAIFKSDKDMAGKFGDLAKFQSSLAKDVIAGTITKDTMNSFMNKINNDFKNGINTNFNEANKIKQSGFDFFGAFSDKMIKGKDEQAKAKNYLNKQLMVQINQAEQNGQTVTQDDINTMSHGILKDYLRQANPQVMGAKDVTNSMITRNGGPQPLHQIPTSIPGSQKAAAPKPAMVMMQTPEGDMVPVHPGKMKEALSRGLIIPKAKK